MKNIQGNCTYPMKACASIDALYPKGTHVTLLIATVPVGILESLLHPLSGNPYAILGPASETLG